MEMSSPLFNNCSGDVDFYHGVSKDSSLPFFSFNHQVDVYFPCKRARISAPLISTLSPFTQTQVSIDDVLPDECLFEILRRLPEGQDRSISACVSKRWLNLLSSIPSRSEMDSDENDGFLTRNLEGKKATDIRLAALAVGTSSRGGLGKLIIRGSTNLMTNVGVTNSGLKAVAASCPSLRVLSLWNLPFVSDEGLIEIAKRCGKLEKLDLSQCPLITDKALVEIARSCPGLTSVTIEGCSNIQNVGFQAFGQFCQNLKTVSIKDCPLVGDQGIAGLFSSAGNIVTKVKLQSLNITDVSLAVIGHYCKAVTELVLTNLQSVNEKGFWCMGNGHGLQKLKTLAITSCRGVTDLGVESLGKGCPNLKSFTLSKSAAFLSDNGLISFAKAAVSLENLQLEECHSITQIGFFNLILCCGAKLKALSFSRCFGIKDVMPMPIGVVLPRSNVSLRSLAVRNCPMFGDANLALLADLCPGLTHLDLSRLHGITDDGVLPLVNNVDAGLVEVKLVNCVNLTDKVILALTKVHGGTLESLNVEGCGKITDASMVGIANDCLVMSDLDLSRSAISDLGLAALARSKQLVSLDVLSVSGCSSLSDKCLSSMVKLGQSLKGLNLQHCNGISSTVISMLTERLWKCDILS